MSNSGLRVLIVENRCTLRYSNEMLVVEKDGIRNDIPIFELQLVVVSTLQVKITTMLIAMLHEHNVRIIFCGKKKSPVVELYSLLDKNSVALKIFEQIEWTSDDKAIMWQKIVQAKIKNQCKTLQSCGNKNITPMLQYLGDVLPDDSTNREAVAAHYYFKALFGNGFSRDRANDINSGLNYGYSIILSVINRNLSVHSYNTCIGIKHCSKTNVYNLSYDLIEFFRPVVDFCVYNNKDMCFDSDFKKELIGLLHMKVIYDGKNQTLSNAIDLFVSDVLNNMKNKDFIIKDMVFGG